jgi:anti-sigma-K factor RskA
MNEEQRELLFDLLAKKAASGLDELEQHEFDKLDDGNVDAEFLSLEMTAAVISTLGYDGSEQLPGHLFAKIAAEADIYLGHAETEASPWPPSKAPIYNAGDVFSKRPSRSWFGWLGWAFAAAACLALAVNIGLTRLNTTEIARVEPPPAIEQPATAAQLRQEFMNATSAMVKANWTVASPKDATPVSGDVVWSIEKQTGYMRFRGLPVNDTSKATYQLWIFDKNQDKATPIDGGTFDVPADGEIVIPINAKLKAMAPEMFAVTLEKPGGVVVSKREKIAAIAKVETQAS